MVLLILPFITNSCICPASTVQDGAALQLACKRLVDANMNTLVHLHRWMSERVYVTWCSLYNCGKVCLSLLGTWSGSHGESWDSAASSALQAPPLLPLAAMPNLLSCLSSSTAWPVSLMRPAPPCMSSHCIQPCPARLPASHRQQCLQAVTLLFPKSCSCCECAWPAAAGANTISAFFQADSAELKGV